MFTQYLIQTLQVSKTYKVYIAALICRSERKYLRKDLCHLHNAWEIFLTTTGTTDFSFIPKSSQSLHF